MLASFLVVARCSPEQNTRGDTKGTTTLRLLSHAADQGVAKRSTDPICCNGILRDMTSKHRKKHRAIEDSPVRCPCLLNCHTQWRQRVCKAP